MQTALVTGRTRCFFLSFGGNHRQYSFRQLTEGWPGWVGLGGLVKYLHENEKFEKKFAKNIGWRVPCFNLYLRTDFVMQMYEH